ncbi:TetR/AcrR family transcriptional regulator [Marinobacter sp. F4216]|uniref:TetR/AcrR family transcriptional regulator n=1 Tax=Marinobacter sp. F4216 TaxID=2874281 RepID=UPI001CBC0928|nr:TetR family transcriptional regulator [Marinobacter sp. F4216]MBZ2170037.1 TetR family transcriptional regulator [Marinobacter sp. F4216]
MGQMEPTTGTKVKPQAELVDAFPAYQGRKVARAKSAARRKAILEAALRIAARDGVRGIKHRSVAQEAGVPLAATTYYFRDINELISDAFLLFAERASHDIQSFCDTLGLVLDNQPPEDLARKSPRRGLLARRLGTIANAFIESHVNGGRDRMLVEQVFLIEALREPHLAEMARRYRHSWIAGLRGVLERLESPHPHEDATLVIDLAFGMGYDQLLGLPGGEAVSLKRGVDRMVNLILGVGYE